ncbi:MAG TPA: endonuclease MutS2 [Bacillota bacterium]|nr:endonuclease MutS2 [Bacillota bacterium]
MNEQTLQKLEFDKIVNRLKKQAETSLGQELCTRLSPSKDLHEVKKLHAETDEAVRVLRLNQMVPLGGITDIRSSLKRSVIGGILNELECLDVATTIYGGRKAKAFIEKLDEELPTLQKLAQNITPLRDLETQIKSCIDDHGRMMDRASAKLHSIRSSIRSFEDRIRDKLESYIKSSSSVLSDAIITIRNDRYVLPVKQEHRTTVGGIVHDQSTSGATLFMEPKAVVDLNNQLQEARSQEKQEIERILQTLSQAIADHRTDLEQNIDALAQIDFIFARAKLARNMKGAMPILNNNGIIKMKQARHPLLPENEVVANDIEIGKDYTSIVITGPNTGGKTVTLKMIGLCTLMAQSGLQIPALDGCEMAVFTNVFADIGDEQSIEQNLSTFSSHMTNIVSIIQQVDDQSLVLFDELGAGTDPQEGAALAMAILDEVIAKNARVVATTHYPELKAYGYNRKYVVNASVEFDVDTLEPTYRLLIGVPGRSNAFDISKRLGLDASIIDQAKSYLGMDSKQVENMISSLDTARKQAEKEYEQARRILYESEKLKRDLEKAWAQFKDKREKLYKQAEQKAEKSLQKAKDEAARIVEDIRQMKTAHSLKEHKWIEAKKRLEDAKPNISKKEQSTPDVKSQKKTKLKPGDTIKLLTVNQEGTVLEKISDDEYRVQVGIMKVKAKRTDLQLIEKPQKLAENPMATVKGKSYHVSPELDLRGERYEDALETLDKYIDDALLAGYQHVSIIHGKGTGALRKGVKTFAEKHERITDFRTGTAEEGGSGVTVLTLS